jgi:hypothetical protein
MKIDLGDTILIIDLPYLSINSVGLGMVRNTNEKNPCRAVEAV